MASWSCEDLVKEITDMEKLFTIRPEATFLQHLKQSLIAKLNACEMSPSLVLKLSTTLMESTLPDTLKLPLMDAVDERASVACAGVLTVTTKQQSLVTIYNYLSKSELAFLQTCTQVDAVSVIATRLKKIGVKTMKETTKKGCVAFLVHLQLKQGLPMPLAPEIYRLAAYVAATFHSCQQTPLVAGYAIYPTTPAELGDEFMTQVYDDGDAPDTKANHYIATSVAALMKSTVKVRKSSNVLKDMFAPVASTQASQGQMLQNHQPQVLQQSQPQVLQQTQPTLSPETLVPMSQLKGMVIGLMAQAKELDANQPPAGGPNLPFKRTDTFTSVESPMSVSKVATPQQNPQAPPVTDTALALEDAQPGSNEKAKTLEDCEDEFYKKLANKKGPCLKRPAAAPKKAKSKAVKKPASAAASKQALSGKEALKAKMCWGCTRCYGNPRGCDGCRKYDFAGVRLNGKDKWVQYKKQQASSSNKKGK